MSNAQIELTIEKDTTVTRMNPSKKRYTTEQAGDVT